MARPELSQQYVNESASEGESDSSGEDSNEDEESVNDGQTTKERKKGQRVSHQDTSSSDSDDTSSDSGSTIQPKITNHNGLKRKISSQESSSPGKKVRSTPAHIPGRAYQPPVGYLPLKSDSQGLNLDLSNLGKKQIWHLTVPASVPFEKIKTFNMQAALRGEPVLDHRGVKYNFYTTSNSSESVLLPLTNLVSTGRGSEVTVAYEASKVPITQTLCLREMLPMPTANDPRDASRSFTASSLQPEVLEMEGNGVMFFATKVGTKPPPRQQPQGLMKRYHPFGSRIGTKERMHRTEVTDTSDDDEPDATHTNGFAVPAALSDDEMDIDTSPKLDKRPKSPKKKEHQHDQNGGEMQKSPKKFKKHKVSAEGTNRHSMGEAVVSNGATSGTAVQSSGKHKEKKKDKHKKKIKGDSKA